MLGLKLELAKQSFFDRDAVMRKLDAATRRALSKFGAFVRRRAKSSIRRRKRASDPGMPPSSHTGLLRDNIFFVYEAEQRSVVIGPILLNLKSSGGTTIPELLETGGDAVRRRYERKVAESKRITYTAHYPARPFMLPAFEIEKQKAAEQFANTIK